MAEQSRWIPREQWSTHPHYPAQLLLLGSHANFRRISRYLVDAADARRDVVDIASLYLRWISAMRSHEAYEEHKLYPYLAQRWSLDFGPATAGHHALHRCHDEVVARMTASLSTSEQGESAAATPELTAALRQHDHELDAHLTLEEDIVIPHLLELSPAEFDRYTRLSIDELLEPATTGAG